MKIITRLLKLIRCKIDLYEFKQLEKKYGKNYPFKETTSVETLLTIKNKSHITNRSNKNMLPLPKKFKIA